MSRSETENPAIPSPTPKATRPRTNRDWWPNQLDLQVLHQHSPQSNPMGEGFDYAKEFASLDVEALETIHRAKTGALIAAAFAMGAIAARGSSRAVDALTAAGSALGLAFQIADDVLDATESSEALGKTARRDAALAKSTYASVLGVPEARRRSDALVADKRMVARERKEDGLGEQLFPAQVFALKWKRQDRSIK